MNSMIPVMCVLCMGCVCVCVCVCVYGVFYVGFVSCVLCVVFSVVCFAFLWRFSWFLLRMLGFFWVSGLFRFHMGHTWVLAFSQRDGVWWPGCLDGH